ncbi:MAG: redox-sensing transcriptional repressor Rex [Syntrophomonadaceae bacterium]|nr:redox-sensing transcriptional repressor Rex [Syntrophomonadaceae bacterium]
MKAYKIPEATVIRLSIYSRQLHLLKDEGVETVSSEEIAESVGVSSAQVRKDLAYFGEFGTRGVGYRVDELLGHLTKILGLDQQWNIAIVGAGKLGSALAVYQGFRERGFAIKAVIDNDPDRVGQRLADLTVEPLEMLTNRVKDFRVNIGIVTVPASAAQAVTDLLVDAGVGAILNFSPRVLKVPAYIVLRNVDLSVNLKVLSFNLSYRR